MKTNKKESVMITIKQKGQLLKVRVPLYKAYEIMAILEKEKYCNLVKEK
jgi:hypothetical protein